MQIEFPTYAFSFFLKNFHHFFQSRSACYEFPQFLFEKIFISPSLLNWVKLFFFLPFRMPCNFYWNLDMAYWVIGTKVNWPSVWGFVLIWLAVELCSMLAVAVGVRGFKFLQYPCFCLLCCLYFLEYEPSSSFSSNPLLLYCWCAG